MKSCNILDVTQPIIYEPMILVFHRRFDATTAIMAADNNMLNFKHLNSIVNDGKTIQIGMHNNIGNITVNKHLTRR